MVDVEDSRVPLPDGEGRLERELHWFCIIMIISHEIEAADNIEILYGNLYKCRQGDRWEVFLNGTKFA